MNKLAERFERAAQLCAILVTGTFLSSALGYLYLDRVNVTRLDFWLIYDTCLTHSWLESALLKYTSHSLFFPSLIWLADLHFFRGNQELVVFVGLALLSSTVALLLIPIWRDETLGVNGRIAATLVLIVGSFWMGRSFIIAHGGFNCIDSLVTCGLAVGLTYLPAMRSDSPHFWRSALIVILGSFVASFSFSVGLACWPALLFLAWCLRLPRVSLVVLVAGGLITAVIFALMPYRGANVHAVAPATISSRVFIPLGWLCQLVGAPVSYAAAAWCPNEISAKLRPPSLLSLWSGAAGLVFAGVVAFPPLVRRNLGETRLKFTGLALLSFNLFAILLIVIGRTTLFRLVPSRVAAQYYFFWSTLFWTGLLLVAIQHFESRKWLRWPALLGALVIPIFAFPRHYQEGVRYRYIRALAESGATSLINGACDPEQIKILFREPKQVYRVAAQLRARRLDMFAAGLQDWIGVRDISLFDGRQKVEGLKGKCRVQAMVQCDNGVPAARVVGWAQRRDGSVPHTLVIVDPEGVVCGVARSSATNKIISRLFYHGNFAGGAFLGYIRDYDARLRYAVRSADDKALSTEKIPVRAQRPAQP